MNDYDVRLQELRNQVAEKKRLEKQQNELCRQKNILQQSLQAREKELAAEQVDVDELERISLASVYYRITGRLQEKLSREQQEAYAAAIKYDAAKKELAAVERQLQSCESALTPLFSCEVLYKMALKEKMQALQKGNSPSAETALNGMQQVADLENKIKELSEALRAGKEAQIKAESVLAALDSADNWNTWDLIGGGGIITHVAKHGHLDEAQERVYTLQEALCRFRTELADVSVSTDFQVSIDGFLRFADYFFDGLFTDWAVGEEIKQSRSQVHGVLRQILSTMEKLECLQKTYQQELEEKKATLDDWVRGQSE